MLKMQEADVRQAQRSREGAPMTTDIRTIERKPDPEVISFLDDALAKARKGEITGVLIISQDVGKWASYSHAGLKDRFHVLGYLSHAMHQLQTDKP